MGKIVLYYKYVDLNAPQEIADWQKSLCQELGLKGRIIIATEGINGTVGGATDKVDQYVTAMKTHPLFADIDFKESPGVLDHFPRLRVVVKKEIVNLGIDPEKLKATDGGIHLDPAQAHELIAQKPQDLIIIDCRNDFESRVGGFEGAVKPHVAHFRDFPKYVDENPDLFKDKQVLMYCTGGVRCERGSAYVKSKGLAKEVFQIRGGIHRYVEQFPQGYFKGKNYVFDGRVAVPVTSDILTTCSLCPEVCDEYTNCLYATCNKQFICCANCLAAYKNTCSSACYELVYEKQLPMRPMRKKVYSSESSCSI